MHSKERKQHKGCKIVARRLCRRKGQKHLLRKHDNMHFHWWLVKLITLHSFNSAQ